MIIFSFVMALLHGDLGWKAFVLIALGCLFTVMLFDVLAFRALKANTGRKRHHKQNNWIHRLKR
jgi:hypothetical protein